MLFLRVIWDGSEVHTNAMGQNPLIFTFQKNIVGDY